MEIRLLRPKDFAKAAALSQAAAYEEAGIEVPLEVARAVYETLPPGSFALGIFNGDDLLASGLAELRPKVHEFKIQNVFVVQDRRKNGVGLKLMQSIIAVADSCEGVDGCYLTVRTDRSNVVELYRNVGFRINQQSSYVGNRCYMYRPRYGAWARKAADFQFVP